MNLNDMKRTKREQEAYRRQIDKAAQELMLNAYRMTVDITESIYKDVLKTLARNIEQYLITHPDKESDGKAT